MIFSIGNHIQQIIDGTKTQTRRPTDRYEVGKTYAVQPGRGKKGIPDGRILILARLPEPKNPAWGGYPIWGEDAQAEGGYTPEEYETLYEEMYPYWELRWAYRFEFVPNEGGMQHRKKP